MLNDNGFIVLIDRPFYFPEINWVLNNSLQPQDIIIAVKDQKDIAAVLCIVGDPDFCPIFQSEINLILELWDNLDVVAHLENVFVVLACYLDVIKG